MLCAKVQVWALYHHLVDMCGTATSWLGDEVQDAFKEDGRCGDFQRAGSLQLLGVVMDDEPAAEPLLPTRPSTGLLRLGQSSLPPPPPPEISALHPF